MNLMLQSLQNLLPGMHQKLEELTKIAANAASEPDAADATQTVEAEPVTTSSPVEKPA